METIAFEIWDVVKEQIDWIIVLVTIISGYFIRAFPMFKQYKKINRVVITSLIVTIAYTYLREIDAGKWLVSWFMSFGLHTVFINWLDKKIFKTVNPVILPPKDGEDTVNPIILPPKEKK